MNMTGWILYFVDTHDKILPPAKKLQKSRHFQKVRIVDSLNVVELDLW